MRLSELSDRSGLSAATIKFYLRERLLPPGASTSQPKRADYGESHVRRLRLIQVLTDVGMLPLAAVRAVLAAVDDSDISIHEVLGIAHSALSLRRRNGVAANGELERARLDVDDYVLRLGWQVDAVQAPARDALAEALAALRHLGWDCDAEIFTPYADIANRLAARELATIPLDAPREQAVEAAVIGTAVFEAAMLALRRLAHSHHSAIRFPTAGNEDPQSRPEQSRPHSGSAP